MRRSRNWPVLQKGLRSYFHALRNLSLGMLRKIEGRFFFYDDLSYETQLTLQVDYPVFANQPY